MNNQVNKLINVLCEMIDVFEKLLLVASEKKKQMVLFDLNNLERTVEDEGKLVDYLMVLEKNSNSILSEINQVFFKTNSMVLKKLVELSKNNAFDEAEDLEKTYEKLIDVTAKLKDVNEKNQNLASFSLGMVRDTVKLICKESKVGTTYKRSGAFESAESLLSLVDMQA